MDPITIAALASMVAGAAVQQNAVSRAAKQQQQQAMLAQQRQLQMRDEATKIATNRAADFDPGTRQQAQDQIAADLTSGYERQVQGPQITAQGVQVGASLPAGQGSTEFLTSQAREQAKTAASLRALAGMLGRTGASTELRRREAVGLGDTADAIGRVQNHAGNIWQADRVGVDAAGQPNPAQMIAGQALNAYGSATMMGAGIPTGPRTNDMGFMARATRQDPTGWWLRNGTSGD